MNGEAKDFLAWVIQCNHPDFPPDVVCDWLEGHVYRSRLKMKASGKLKRI